MKKSSRKISIFLIYFFLISIIPTSLFSEIVNAQTTLKKIEFKPTFYYLNSTVQFKNKTFTSSYQSQSIDVLPNNSGLPINSQGFVQLIGRTPTKLYYSNVHNNDIYKVDVTSNSGNVIQASDLYSSFNSNGINVPNYASNFFYNEDLLWILGYQNGKYLLANKNGFNKEYLSSDINYGNIQLDSKGNIFFIDTKNKCFITLDSTGVETKDIVPNEINTYDYLGQVFLDNQGNIYINTYDSKLYILSKINDKFQVSKVYNNVSNIYQAYQDKKIIYNTINNTTGTAVTGVIDSSLNLVPKYTSDAYSFLDAFDENNMLFSSAFKLAVITQATPKSAPNVKLNFDGINANKLMDSTTDMEYSIDNGETYTEITTNDMTLSNDVLNNLTYQNGIIVRYKDTSLNIPNCVIKLNQGPKTPTNLVNNDLLNTITGLSSKMEFSANMGATWTKFTGTTMSNLNGDIVLQVRISATGKNLPSDKKTFTFTQNEPIELSAAFSSNIKEGFENNSLINLNISKGIFASKIDSSKVHLTGLPAGIKLGKITRKNDNTLSIQLSGNSSVDYDVDQKIEISIDTSLALPSQPSLPSSNVTLPATVENPGVPNATFSFNGRDAGKLIGSEKSMVFSIDGGNSYIPVKSKNQSLTKDLISKLSSDNDIIIRYSKTLRYDESTAQVIDILPSPMAPTLTASDSSNTLIGIDTTMEFSTNNGITWTKYTLSSTGKGNLPSLTGNITLLVRTCATNTTLSGISCEPIIFTKNIK